MRKEFARDFWKEYFRIICNGSAAMSVENPACAFTEKVKIGEYDALSDEEYNKMLADIEQIQPLWNNQRRRAAGDVFLDALAKTTLYGFRLDNIIELLAESSVHSDYRLKQCISRQEQIHKAQRERANITFESDTEYDDLWSPKAIYDICVSERIQGQEDAKKAAALIVYNQAEGRRSNTIFCGPSGCGKSEIWRCLAETFPSVRMIDASRLVADGWKGSVHVRDIFERVPPETLQNGLIVVLDEADKICCETAVGSGGTDYNRLTQNSLLKIMDGDVVEFGKEDGKKELKVDCSKVSVVLLGAFETLLQSKSRKNSGGIGFGAAPHTECNYANTEITYADLVDAGMRQEIAGRINRIVPLQPLSVADYKAILTDHVLKDLQCAGKCKIEIDDDSVNFLAEKAVSTGLGVRWLRSQIMNAVDDLMFDNPSADVYSIKIPPETKKDRECCPVAG